MYMDRWTERKRDRETERPRDGETKRQRDRDIHVHAPCHADMRNKKASLAADSSSHHYKIRTPGKHATVEGIPTQHFHFRL